MEQEIVLVRKCPKCGDMWIDTENDVKNCLCFRCKTKYLSSSTVTMYLWVYDLVKKVKGN